MASLKEQYKGKVKFYFVEYNQAESQPIVQRFNIQSHPQTFILDKDDKVVYQMKGFGDTGIQQSKQTLMDEINKVVATDKQAK